MVTFWVQLHLISLAGISTRLGVFGSMGSRSKYAWKPVFKVLEAILQGDFGSIESGAPIWIMGGGAGRSGSGQGGWGSIESGDRIGMAGGWPGCGGMAVGDGFWPIGTPS